LFLIYISIFATLHFESIEHMNITIIFLFIAMVSYFLISAIYMVSENKKTACNTSDNILCGHCFHYDLCIQGNWYIRFSQVFNYLYNYSCSNICLCSCDKEI